MVWIREAQWQAPLGRPQKLSYDPPTPGYALLGFSDQPSEDSSTASSLLGLRELLLQEKVLVCFNGPTTRTLISEIGVALRNHIHQTVQSLPAAMDVFGAYIEVSQNICHYADSRHYSEPDSVATVVIAERSDGRYLIKAGNMIEAHDGPPLVKRIRHLSGMSKPELQALYKQQLHRKRLQGESHGAGLGLIQVARIAVEPIQCGLDMLGADRAFFTLCVTI